MQKRGDYANFKNNSKIVIIPRDSVGQCIM